MAFLRHLDLVVRHGNASRMQWMELFLLQRTGVLSQSVVRCDVKSHIKNKY
jgi:hypothetical protein